MKRHFVPLVVVVILGFATPGLAAGRPGSGGGGVSCPADRLNFAPSSGAQLQTALDCADPGATITLKSGASNVYDGNFTLRQKPVAYESDGNTPKRITIQSESVANGSLPPDTRVGAAHEPFLAWLKVPSGSSSPVLLTELKRMPDRTKSPASHYRVVGVKFFTNHWVNHLVRLGTTTERLLSELPENITFDRSSFAGSAGAGTKQGLVANGRSIVVTNSSFVDFKDTANDAQAIIIWNGAGPYLIQNNHLQGSGENMMVGGGDPTIDDLVPADITIRWNHFFKPTAWTTETSTANGSKWRIKNLFELKNARRVRIEGNIFENNWIQADQHGFAIVFTPRNQSGGCRWCVVEDVEFVNNLVKNSTAGINLLVTDDTRPSQQIRRLGIRNNLLVNINGDAVPGTPTLDRAGRLIQILNPSTATEPIKVTVERNTAFASRAASTNAGGEVSFSAWQPSSGFRLVKNVVRHNGCPNINDCGISGDGTGPGDASLSAWFSDCCSASDPIADRNIVFDGPDGIATSYELVPTNEFVEFGSVNFQSGPGTIDPITGEAISDTPPDYDVVGADGLPVGIGVDWELLKVHIEAAFSGLPPALP